MQRAFYSQGLLGEGFVVVNLPAIRLGVYTGNPYSGRLGARHSLTLLGPPLALLIHASLFLSIFLPSCSLPSCPQAEMLPLVYFLNNYLEPDPVFQKLVGEANTCLSMPALTGHNFDGGARKR